MVNQHKKKSDMSGIVIVTVLILIVGLGIYGIVQEFLPEKQKEVAGDPYTELYTTQPTVGNTDSKVKVIGFADFKCPGCRDFAQQIFPQLKKDYIDTGKISFTYSIYPFLGPDSNTAAEAAHSVYKHHPDQFLKFVDTVYKNQGPKSQQWATETFLVDLIRKNIPEIDANKIEQDLKNKAFSEAVKNGYDLTKAAGIDSTPTVAVNGKIVEDPFDYNSVKAAIEEALKQ